MLLDGDAQRTGPAALPETLLPSGGTPLPRPPGASPRIPVTVVWGSADRVIPPAQAGSVPGAVFRLVDRAGHMPHMERPAEVQAAIEETIARAP